MQQFFYSSTAFSHVQRRSAQCSAVWYSERKRGAHTATVAPTEQPRSRLGRLFTSSEKPFFCIENNFVPMEKKKVDFSFLQLLAIALGSV